MGLKLSDNIKLLHGVGEKRAVLYKKLGVATIGDLLTFYPRNYIDLSNPVSIKDSVLNEVNVIKAAVFKKQGEQRIRKGLSVFKVFATDGSDTLIITIFNSKYMFEALKEGEEYIFTGKVTGSLLKHEMNSPLFVKASEENLVRPVYPLTEGLTNKIVQSNTAEALSVWGDCLQDTLPPYLLKEEKLCCLRYAVENIHFPKDGKALETAKKRLVFEELLTLQLGLIMLSSKNRTATELSLSDKSIDEFFEALPFELTDGQKNAISDGLSDMQKDVPMNRLVQGDVGSGKTMVAAALCYAAHKNGCQSAIMAPTQILAEQHYETLKQILAPLGAEICLLTGGQTKKQKDEITEGIASGKYSVAVGTHALVQENVRFKKLMLVVTDEQHRFGVRQRALLASKGENPHLLVMSATPIPRTLALIIYGDLDISVISELPKGRKPIDTLSVNSEKRGRALGFIKKNIDEGRQAYIVCPLIEENGSELASTEVYIKELRKTPLREYRIEALTGKHKPKEKEQIMSDFKAGLIDILVSTTVVEVGVDVPNANIMMIENAERFGLSQLHQLRGRVGRGEYKSYCILVSDNRGEENRRRIKTMVSTSDGFVIAEEDLKQRGPGDFFGHKQHGLPELKLASFIDNTDVLQKTAIIAREILERDSELLLPENRMLKEKTKRLFSQTEQETLN